MRVLLVEDSQRLQRSLGKALRQSGYALDVAGDGESGWWQAQSNPYDAIVLDLMLPKLDGMGVLGRLRQGGTQTPILLLTARDELADRVAGLQAGADDYLVKPFALAELLARVQALCRRGYGTQRNRLEVAELVIDLTSRRVFRGEVALELTAREFSLLEYLALRRGQIVSRTEIETHLYADTTELMSNAVDSAICSLRKKLGAPGGAPLIHTKRGVGYLLQESA